MHWLYMNCENSSDFIRPYDSDESFKNANTFSGISFFTNTSHKVRVGHDVRRALPELQTRAPGGTRYRHHAPPRWILQICNPRAISVCLADMNTPKSVRDYMSKLGKRGGAIRAETLTPERKTVIARNAAVARWVKYRILHNASK